MFIFKLVKVLIFMAVLFSCASKLYNRSRAMPNAYDYCCYCCCFYCQSDGVCRSPARALREPVRSGEWRVQSTYSESMLTSFSSNMSLTWLSRRLLAPMKPGKPTRCLCSSKELFTLNEYFTWQNTTVIESYMLWPFSGGKYFAASQLL